MAAERVDRLPALPLVANDLQVSQMLRLVEFALVQVAPVCRLHVDRTPSVARPLSLGRLQVAVLPAEHLYDPVAIEKT